MSRSLFAWTTALLVVAAAMIAIAVPASADENGNFPAPGGPFTIDGLAGDWSNIPVKNLFLSDPSDDTHTVPNAKYQVTNDNSNIYVLVMIPDTFDYDPTNHDMSAALAVQWQIDSNALINMGGGQGKVDLWHWELDSAPGLPTGFNLVSGDDPWGNLDDEWANSPNDRHDDDSHNEILGAWSHTNMAFEADGTGSGGDGMWIFELMRPLTTDNPAEDVQLTIGSTAKMAFAYWDPSQTATGWVPENHMVSDWLNVPIQAAASGGGPDLSGIDFSGLVNTTVFEELNATATNLSGQVADLTAALAAAEAEVAALNANNESLYASIDAAETAAAAAQAEATAAKLEAQDATDVAGSADFINYIALGLGIVAVIFGLVAMLLAFSKGGSTPRQED